MQNLGDQGGEKNQDITEEVDSYYQADNESSTGSALLYGLFALVVTLIVAAGLYFGGRAVYRALTGTSNQQTTEQQQEEQNTSNGAQEAEPAEEDTNQTPGVESDGNGTSESEDRDNQTGENGTESIPSTGDSLPRTGSPTGM